MTSETNNRIEFRPEVREWLDSGGQSGTFKSDSGSESLFLKAGNVGLHEDLVSKGVRLILARPSYYTLDDAWKTAAAYDGRTLEPVMFTFAGSHLIVGGAKKIGASDDSLRLGYEEVKKRVRAKVWEAIAPETDRADYADAGRVWIGPNDLKKRYIASGSFEKDWAVQIDMPDPTTEAWLRAAVAPEGLEGELVEAALNHDYSVLVKQAAAWKALVRESGDAIASECESYRKMFCALEGLDASTVKCVFSGEGDDPGYEASVKLWNLRNYLRNPFLYRGLRYDDFSPRLKEDPDMERFAGVKYRGKWVFKTDEL